MFFKKKKKKEDPQMSWWDVTLGQFQQLKKVDLSELDGQIEAASILLGINTDDMTWAQFCEELKKLNFLKNPIPKTIVRKSYVLNGKKYDCFSDLSNMSVSRYMDWSKLAPTQDYAKILCVFLVPEGKEYGSYDLKEVEEDIKTMNVVEAYGIFNFFRLQFIVCIKTIKDYSVKNLKKYPQLQKVVSDLMESYSMLDQ